MIKRPPQRFELWHSLVTLFAIFIACQLFGLITIFSANGMIAPLAVVLWSTMLGIMVYLLMQLRQQLGLLCKAISRRSR